MNIDQLTHWLLSDDPAPLGKEDRAILARALAELAVAQALIARQSLLLDSFGTDHRQLESTLRASIDRATASLADRRTVTGYDTDAAEKARKALSAGIANAQSLRDLISIGLRLAGVLAAG